jgi:hypothetical protein
MTAEPAAAKQPPEVIYILDTNLILDFLTHGKVSLNEDTREPQWVKNNKDAIAWLLKTASVVIPHIVLVEVVGNLLQQRIDLANYEQWYRARYAALNPLLSAIFNQRRDVSLHSQITRVDAVNAAVTQLSKELREELGRFAIRVPTAGGRQRDPKVLDGVDAQILDEAATIAAKTPSAWCWLATNDRGLALMVDDVSRRAEHDPRFPRNLYSLPARDLVRHFKQRNLRGGIS